MVQANKQTNKQGYANNLTSFIKTQFASVHYLAQIPAPQQLEGSGLAPAIPFGNSALVRDSKEASPCLLALSPMSHRHSQMMDTATNTITAALMGQGTGMLGQTRLGWNKGRDSPAHCNIPSSICHLHTTHKEAKLGNAAPLKQGLQQQEHKSFKGESKCKMQLLFFICIILPLRHKKP